METNKVRDALELIISHHLGLNASKGRDPQHSKTIRFARQGLTALDAMNARPQVSEVELGHLLRALELVKLNTSSPSLAVTLKVRELEPFGDGHNLQHAISNTDAASLIQALVDKNTAALAAEVERLSVALDNAIATITAHLVSGEVSKEGWQITLDELVAAQQKQEGYAMKTAVEWASQLRHTSGDYPLELRMKIDEHNERIIELVRAEGFKAGQDSMRERAAAEAIASCDEYGLGIAVEIRALPVEEQQVELIL